MTIVYTKKIKNKKIIILFFTPYNKILTQDTIDPLKENPGALWVVHLFKAN